jgi:(S)-2-hydroxy-acid oxidase
MEYPNLFPGVDVTNLEDGDEVMAYGNYCLWGSIRNGPD